MPPNSTTAQPTTSISDDNSGKSPAIVAIGGVFKAFGGVVAIGTLLMWLMGDTYSTDILNQFGISPVFINRPFQMIALLGLQVLLAWIHDQASSGNAVVLFAASAAGILVVVFILARARALIAMIFTVLGCGAAIWIAPIVGHAEAQGYLSQLRPNVEACRTDSRWCTSYQTTQGVSVLGVLVTADDTRMFIATPTGVTQMLLAQLATVSPPAPAGQSVAIAISEPSPGSVLPPSPAATSGPVSPASSTPVPAPPQIVDPMPEDVIFPHQLPELPKGNAPTPTHPMPGKLYPDKFAKPAPNFVPDNAFAHKL